MKGKLEGFLPAAALMAVLTGVSLVVVGSGAAHSQNQPPPRGLPEEALEACESLTLDDACPITLPDGKSLTGACALTPDEKLACMPDGDQGPPPPRN